MNIKVGEYYTTQNDELSVVRIDEINNEVSWPICGTYIIGPHKGKRCTWSTEKVHRCAEAVGENDRLLSKVDLNKFPEYRL